MKNRAKVNNIVVDDNTINLVGVVSEIPKYNYTTFGEKFYQFIISVERHSGKSDNLPVIVSERLMDLSEIQLGKCVSINGQIRTHNTWEDDRNKLLINVFAKEIVVNADADKCDLDFRNSLSLTGFICKEPKYRETLTKGRKITELMLAVNRLYGKSDYIPSIVWERNAQYAADLQKGTKVKVSGRLQSREFTKKISETEMKPYVVYEVSINAIEEIVKDNEE